MRGEERKKGMRKDTDKKRSHRVPIAGWAAAFFAKGHPPNAGTVDLPEWNGGHGFLTASYEEK